MPGLTEDYSGSMILYALKFIQFIVRMLLGREATNKQEPPTSLFHLKGADGGGDEGGGGGQWMGG